MQQDGILIGFSSFARREVITLQSGQKIGYADDLLFDVKEGKITGVVIYGRNRWFTESEDLFIPWEEIKLFGEDTLLVGKADKIPPSRKRKMIGLFDRFTALLNKDG